MSDRDSVTVAIVGAGNVGSTFGYALLLNGLAAEIVLIDANRAKAEGEAMDLNHTMPFAHPTRIWAGDYSDCAGAAVTVLAAGSGQRPGQSRLNCIQAGFVLCLKIGPYRLSTCGRCFRRAGKRAPRRALLRPSSKTDCSRTLRFSPKPPRKSRRASHFDGHVDAVTEDWVRGRRLFPRERGKRRP